MSVIAADVPAWRRVAAEVVERRIALDLTQEDIAARGGPSTATMRIIEGSLQKSYRAATIRQLEVALAWEPGSIRQIIDGGQPAVSSSPSFPVKAAGGREGAPAEDVGKRWQEELVSKIWMNQVLTDDQKFEAVRSLMTAMAEIRAIEDRVTRSA